MNQLYLNDNLSRFEFYNTDCYENVLHSRFYLFRVRSTYDFAVLFSLYRSSADRLVSEFIAKFMRLC